MSYQTDIMNFISNEVSRSANVSIAKSLDSMAESIKNIESKLTSMYTNTDSVYTSINGVTLSEGEDGFTDVVVANKRCQIHITSERFEIYIADHIMLINVYEREQIYKWIDNDEENEQSMTKIIGYISEKCVNGIFEIKESEIRESLKENYCNLSIFDIKLIVKYYNLLYLYYGGKCEVRLIIGE